MILEAMSLCWGQSKGSDNQRAALLSVALFIAIAIAWWRKSRQQKGLLPPGPWGLPIVGNLPFLDLDLHRCFAQLSLRYGPVMKLYLGSRLCTVISSPEAAKQVLQDHDADFADRDIPATAAAFSYGEADIAFSPYGAHWRMMRKICVAELLSHGNLQALHSLRRREVRHMVSNIHSKIGSSVNIHEHVLITQFSIITSMMWGNTLSCEQMICVNTQCREAMDKIMDLIGEVNVSDFFPLLAQYDLQGKVRHMKELTRQCDSIFKFVVDERKKIDDSGDCKGKTDFLQILLQLKDQAEQETPFTDTDMKALFLDILLAGGKPAATNVEWAMAELLKHPEIMEKAQNELDQVVGLGNVVEESHLARLPYLEAILKEAMRLHPVGPLLIPRRAKVSHIIGGYLIPKGSKIFVNAWSIQRDPKYWTDPLEFQPERFLSSPVDWNYTGNDFRYIPFGSGRRMCVGIHLGVKSVSYLLASLLHSFNWELPQGSELDLSEKFSLELSKKIPLVAIPSAKLSGIGL